MKAFFVVVLVAALIGCTLTQNNLCIPQTFSTAVYASLAATVNNQVVFQEHLGQYYFDLTQQAVSIQMTPIGSNSAAYTVLTLYKTGTMYVITPNNCESSSTTETLSNCFDYTNITGPYILGAVLDTWMATYETQNVSTTILYDNKMNTPISTRAIGSFDNGNGNSGTFVDYTLMYNVSLSAISPSVFVPPASCNKGISQKIKLFGGIKPTVFSL